MYIFSLKLGALTIQTGGFAFEVIFAVSFPISKETKNFTLKFTIYCHGPCCNSSPGQEGYIDVATSNIHKLKYTAKQHCTFPLLCLSHHNSLACQTLTLGVGFFFFCVQVAL